MASAFAGVQTDFDFSKLVSVDDKKPHKKTRKEKRETFRGRDYKQLLEKVEKRQQRIEKIREVAPDKADTVENDIKWNTILRRAGGEKIKDNPLLLNKGMKRKEKMKERTKKKWSERKQKEKKDQAQRQQKRRDNIQKRKEKVLNNKIQKAKKKGRFVSKK